MITCNLIRVLLDYNSIFIHLIVEQIHVAIIQSIF